MEQNNFIPYGRQSISEEDIAAVNNVLRSSFITQGPVSLEFEYSLAKTVESNYAVSTNSATSALHIACLALGLKKGEILWTSPNTFVASANCALFCQALVDFVDIDIETGLMSIELLEKKLEIASKNNQLPKIVVPVHFAGTSCDMKAIYKLCREFFFNN